MKQNNITDKLFEATSTINKVSQTGNLYGRLMELKDLELHIAKRIIEIQSQIDELANGELVIGFMGAVIILYYYT